MERVGRLFEGGSIIPLSFYVRQPDAVAPELLGRTLVSCFGGSCKACVIVETEAYLGECDPASRARKGRGRIWKALYGPQGLTLVYGMHRQWLLNIVAHEDGMAGAVLIRACQPIWGIDPGTTTSGPGRLTRALGIRKDADSLPVYMKSSPIQVWSSGLEDFEIERSQRIGVSEDLEIPLRFYIKGNKFVSKARKPF